MRRENKTRLCIKDFAEIILTPCICPNEASCPYKQSRNLMHMEIPAFLHTTCESNIPSFFFQEHLCLPLLLLRQQPENVICEFSNNKIPHLK